jgi:hypothetical protein
MPKHCIEFALRTGDCSGRCRWATSPGLASDAPHSHGATIGAAPPASTWQGMHKPPIVCMHARTSNHGHLPPGAITHGPHYSLHHRPFVQSIDSMASGTRAYPPPSGKTFCRWPYREQALRVFLACRTKLNTPATVIHCAPAATASGLAGVLLQAARHAHALLCR